MNRLDPNKLLSSLLNNTPVAGYQVLKAYTGEIAVMVLSPNLLTQEQVMLACNKSLKLQNFYKLSGDMDATEIVYILDREEGGEDLLKQLLGISA